uniref:NADH-ubiquinone oxidoreductase chain 3 n=1 Tax=Tenebrionoidea sp. 4 KM-2017 TaxID=2219482 RepID=A0A346RJH9_9CUCU|nr:NADH dehydrogenase subunit 3 [Tenebrionoidea sp. 4 KM-2017]
MLMSISSMILVIMVALVTVLNLVSKKSIIDREKSSPFECGFEPKTSARLPFSLHFFLIALIFLIFDVEITLIFPFIIMFKYSSMLNMFLIFMFFIIVLLVGLYHEWNQGALNWTP